MTKTAPDFSWLNTEAEAAARRLLGCELLSTVDDERVRVRIVETEAYDQTDEASHAFKGRTARNDAMFQAAGHLYVYFTYGMHYCCNIVCGEEGYGAGALIRAVEPIEGRDVIERRRGMTGINATNGPGKVAQALGINLTLSGHNLSQPPIQLLQKPPLSEGTVTVAKRIGISKAVHELRRYYLTDSPYVSKRSALEV